jgi:hypothetical protein
MSKRILLCGLLGFVTIMAWTFVANGLFRLTSSIRMNQLPDEPAVYQVLKQYVTEPDGYTVNPEGIPGVGYPPGEPVFKVLYSGFGHEAAGRLFFLEAGIALASTLLVALLLSMASEAVLSRYWRKVLFVVIVGAFVVVFGDLTDYGIGGYPLRSALLMGLNSLVMWTLAGLVMARFMTPETTAGPQT